MALVEKTVFWALLRRTITVFPTDFIFNYLRRMVVIFYFIY